MATTGDVHVGDVGTLYKAKIQDGGVPFPDMAAATVGLITWKTPSGLMERDFGDGVTVTTDTVDYYLEYIMIESDIADGLHALKGNYSWQGYVEFPGGQKYHTNIETFTVEKNLG